VRISGGKKRQGKTRVEVWGSRKKKAEKASKEKREPLLETFTIGEGNRGSYHLNIKRKSSTPPERTKEPESGKSKKEKGGKKFR